MKAIVVTGHGGFIGRHVCQLASEHGVPVVAIGSPPHIDPIPGACRPERIVEECISSSALQRAMDGVQPIAIIHCAGTGTVRRATEAPHEEFERSVGATGELLEFVRRHLHPKPRFVLASSAAVYGETSTTPAAESDPCRPISVYGFHKLMAEQLCQCYAQQFELPVTVVRLFSVYGPGLRKQLPWDAMNRIRSGSCHFNCTGNELRDWLHVRDAAKLLWRASQHAQEPWSVVNSSGARASTAEVLKMLARLAGVKQAPTFSGTSQPFNPTHLIGSSDKAERILGWRPEIPLHDGLAGFVAWCGKVMPAP